MLDRQIQREVYWNSINVIGILKCEAPRQTKLASQNIYLSERERIDQSFAILLSEDQRLVGKMTGSIASVFWGMGILNLFSTAYASMPGSGVAPELSIISPVAPSPSPSTPEHPPDFQIHVVQKSSLFKNVRCGISCTERGCAYTTLQSE